jgi:hypothetical protein
MFRCGPVLGAPPAAARKCLTPPIWRTGWWVWRAQAVAGTTTSSWRDAALTWSSTRLPAATYGNLYRLLQKKLLSRRWNAAAGMQERTMVSLLELRWFILCRWKLSRQTRPDVAVQRREDWRWKWIPNCIGRLCLLELRLASCVYCDSHLMSISVFYHRDLVVAGN